MDEFEQDSSRTSKIGQIIGIIICLVAIVGLSYGLIFISHEKRQFNANYLETEKLIADQQDILEMQQTEIANISKEIEHNKNIELLTDELKDNYPVIASQLERNIINGDSNAKIAYLTFDDGPYKLTNKFLDVLDKYNVRATFFCLEKDEKYGYTDEDLEIVNNIYKRIINNGHTLGNHTSSHHIKRKFKDYIYESVDNFMNSIIENRNFVYDTYGYTTTIMRFPGGSSRAYELKDSIIESLNNEHYGYVDWNSATGDGEEVISPSQSVKNILDNTNDRKFLVVLMHDYSENTLEALPDIIEGLKEQGYTLLPLFYESTMVKKE